MIHAAVRKFPLGTAILAIIICTCVAIVPMYLLHAHAMSMKTKAQAVSATSKQGPRATPDPVRLADRMLFEKLFSSWPSLQPPFGPR
jgi:deoxyinosine 3'endonuclease (endonuclease V)